MSLPESWFLKGLLVSLIFGVPAGAIGALTLRRTLHGGFAAGLATGLGSTAADVLYAAIGVLGINAVSDFLLRYQSAFRAVGGLFVIGLGAVILRKRESVDLSDGKPLRLPACFASSFAIAIANPATILAFFTAFAMLGIEQSLTLRESAWLLAGITLGTACWWAALAGAAAFLRRRITAKALAVLNRILGGFMVLFGLYALAQAAGILS